ncbi:MAG: HEAT repeat domain-containing protein [Candidatus Hydrogenedentota bacterium]
MYNRITALCLALALMSMTTIAQIPINNGDGATMDDLIREKTLVTIVLNGNVPVRDPNLQITRLNKDTITFIGADGRNSAYPLSDVKYIRVQEKRTAQKQTIFSKGTLSRDERKIVDRAKGRVVELFQSETDPNNKMRAACLAAILGEDGAILYLQAHAQSNDTPTAVLATTYLYAAGEAIHKDLLTDGFLHGNRATRVQTAVLAGLYGGESFLRDLRYMADDPHPEVNPSAIRALARIGDRWVVPKLYDGLDALKQPKNEAVIYGLSKLGDEDVIKELTKRLPLARKNEWFRIIRVLYALGDEEAANQMRETGLKTYAYEQPSGLLLGENDDWEGGVWIREYLKRPKDPDYKNLMFRANLAAALYGTGQSQAKIVFQNLMHLTNTQIFAKGNATNTQYKEAILTEVQEEVCRLLGEQGDKTMLSLLHGPMESKNTSLALAACEAIVMIANESYRERISEYNHYTGYRERLLPGFFK